MAGLSSPICCYTGDATTATTSGLPTFKTKFIQTANKSVVYPLTETSIIGTGLGSLVFAPSEMVVGTTFRITAEGSGLMVGFADTLTIKINLGGTLLATNSGDVIQNLTSNTVNISALFTLQSIGATAAIHGQGNFGFAVNTNWSAARLLNAGNTYSTNIPLALDLTATWSGAGDGTSLTMTNFVLEVLNA